MANYMFATRRGISQCQMCATWQAIQVNSRTFFDISLLLKMDLSMTVVVS